MKRPDGSGGRRIAVAAAGVALLAMGAVTPAAGQGHDLVMFSFDADPKPLKRGCSASLFASFLINGHMDDQLSSGDAQISFYWADGSAAVPTVASGWSLIGTLPVTWAASDGVFAPGREWPTGFPSVAASSQSWTVPTGPTTFHLMAEASYTAVGVSDDVPGNNRVVLPSLPSEPGSCGGSGNCCTVTAGGLMICTLACLDREIFHIPREAIACLVRPELCNPVPIPICEIIDCNPCLRGLTCPPEPWELLVRWPEDIMRIELIAGGEAVARSVPLERPIERGGQTFHQVIRFESEKGVAYSLRAEAGPRAKPGEVYPLTVEALPRERGKDAY